jgi:serine/threonine-protein kinase
MASHPTVRTLGRYQLVEPIAVGTTATVWRAYDKRTRTEVAVKRFHPHLFSDRSARKRMEAEAKAAQKVRGKTIVSAIDRISTSDEFALVFPFVEGQSLAEQLAESGKPPPAQAATVAADVADALVAIHRAGFVHRDVKPGNVLIRSSGQALLLDFGISRAVTEAIEGEQALTGAGTTIGTLPYMAPEQLTGAGVTAATDVYALGAVLYEMLAGQRPYQATTPVALATEQRLAPARIDGAPAPLVDLALRAMAFDPLARPTARQFAEAMRSWLHAPVAIDAQTAPVTAVVAAAASGERPERRPAVLAAALAVGAFLLVAFVALAAIAPASAPSGSSPTDAPAAAYADGATPTPTPTATPSQEIPAVVPANNPSPTKPPAAKPAPTPPPQPSPPAPKHHAHHHGGHHHKHGGHHHKRHH